MKRLNLSLLLLLGLCQWVVAQPSPVFLNVGTLTTRTNIDAKVFINRGLIFYDLLNPKFVTGAPEFAVGSEDNVPFQTKDTIAYTNTGVMVAQPGFIFENVGGSGIHPSGSFDNSGTILTLDGPVLGLTTLGTTVSLPPQAAGPGTNYPIPSILTVSATNITISGLMQTGDQGVMQLTGSAVHLNNGALQAGTISDVDTNNTLGRGALNGAFITTGIGTYGPVEDVYDIYWSITNNATNTGDIAFIEQSIDPTFSIVPELQVDFPWHIESRNGFLNGQELDAVNTTGIAKDFFPISTLIPGVGVTPTVTSTPAAPNFVGYASFNFTPTAANALITNNYINIVVVNNGVTDTNITVSAPEFIAVGVNADLPFQSVVKFSAPTMNVISGQIETNSIYFLDSGQVYYFLNGGLALQTNSVYISDAKPDCFEITRTAPDEFGEGLPANFPFADALALINPTNEFASNAVPVDSAIYAAMVGRNPEVVNGLFDYDSTLLGKTGNGMPDQTNEAARIEVSAKALDVTNLRLSANGVVKFNSPKLTGLPAATDFGNMNIDLGSNNTPLVIKNLFPSNFNRLRGDIAAYSVDFVNQQTNNGLGTGQANRVTNFYYYHILILDQDLRDNFKTTGLNVALRGNSVEVDDPLTIITSALFQASNLTVNAAVHLTGSAGTLQGATVPGLKSLLIGNAGNLAADNFINLGVSASASTVIPTVKNTAIRSITNLGTIASQEIELQSQVFANGGSITATNNGAIIVNALTNYLGAGRGVANSFIADSDINLTGSSIQVSNSTILAGQNGAGQLVIHSSAELTDHFPNFASTNAYVTNQWRVTAGFSLPVKPVSGDLFGTQITTVAGRPNQRILHSWAAQDLGPNAAGFFNNAVIGHLVLNRTTNSANSTFVFSPAGKKNAMYVDNLEFDENLPGKDYHSGLEIDPGLTIYFATANIDPTKLHQVYPNLVWVPNFAGPNSATNINYAGGSNCLMNAALATSGSIDTDGDGVVNASDSQQLNNPTLGGVPCPSLVTATQALPVTNGVAAQQFVVWTTGQGHVTPALPSRGLAAGEKFILTAVPAPGWLFLDWSGQVVSSGATISLTIPTNQTFGFVTANFITNPFIGLAGAYNGLFSVPAAVSNNSSGFVTFTLNNQGIFSGKLTIGSTNYPFSSRFNIANQASFFATNGRNVLSVSLQVGLNQQADVATGTVSNGVFNATVTAYQKPGFTAAHPSPQKGTYTLVLLGNDDAAVSPGGNSYGTVTVDSLGNVKAIGSLADGASFSQSVPVSREGNWPLYLAPSGSSQTLFGFVNFNSNGVAGTSTGFAGQLTWIKLPGAGPLYPSGFTNTSTLTGSIYSSSFQKTNGLMLNNPTISLVGGNLPNSIIASVVATGPQTFQTADKAITLTINAATGGFSGTYTTPAKKKVALNGVVLQNGGTADGFFLGANQTGSVVLQGN